MASNYEKIINEKDNLIEELICCLADCLCEEDFINTMDHCEIDPEEIDGYLQRFY